MSGTRRKRFWVETILACLSGSLAVLTLIWHNWVELLFEAEPDGGDGSFEWALVVVLLAATVVFSVLARIEWRRALCPNRLEGSKAGPT
jgi:hypothetical protein